MSASYCFKNCAFINKAKILKIQHEICDLCNKKIMATPFTNCKMIPDTPFYINYWCLCNLMILEYYSKIKSSLQNTIDKKCVSKVYLCVSVQTLSIFYEQYTAMFSHVQHPTKQHSDFQWWIFLSASFLFLNFKNLFQSKFCLNI